MKGKFVQFVAGIIAGAVLVPTTHAAVQQLAATSSAQKFYVDGTPVQLEAYAINGSNYVKLRDIGEAVGFHVSYDGSTNSVHIDPNAHYEQEATIPAQTTPTPSGLTEENVRAAIVSLRERYPHGTVYETPYRPNNSLDRPFDNCDHCAGWAMLCSDAAFGDLPWRRVDRPSWEQIRAGDLVEYRNGTTHHVVVVLDRTDEYISTTESGTNNKARWGGQYPQWWLEGQSTYILYTRYPQ